MHRKWRRVATNFSEPASTLRISDRTDPSSNASDGPDLLFPRQSYGIILSSLLVKEVD